MKKDIMLEPTDDSARFGNFWADDKGVGGPGFWMGAGHFTPYSIARRLDEAYKQGLRDGGNGK